MPFMCQNVVATLTSDGTADGIVAVADSKQFWPGAVCFLTATGVPDLEVVILSDGPAANQVRVRDRAAKHYGPANITAYTSALNATLRQPSQMIWGTPIEGIVPRIPSFIATPA